MRIKVKVKQTGQIFELACNSPSKVKSILIDEIKNTNSNILNQIDFEKIEYDILSVFHEDFKCWIQQDQINEQEIIIIPEYKHGFVYSWTYSINGKKSSKVAENKDIAMLLALEEKYLGHNEKWAKYSAKILDIETLWKD